MSELYTQTTHCFWHFIATIMILGTVCHYISYVLIRFYRMITVMVKGWPPVHLDADGDHIETIKRHTT